MLRRAADADARWSKRYVGRQRYPRLRGRNGRYGGQADAAVCRDENTDTAEDNDCTDAGGSERLYYANGGNMEVTALLSESGAVVERYVYDPYGKVTIYDDDWSQTVAWADSKKNEVLYCGYRCNPEAGLYQVRYRELHPTMAWMQRDQLEYTDGMNLLAYARCAPVLKVDPYGLSESSAAMYSWAYWYGRMPDRTPPPITGAAAKSRAKALLLKEQVNYSTCALYGPSGLDGFFGRLIATLDKVDILAVDPTKVPKGADGACISSHPLLGGRATRVEVYLLSLNDPKVLIEELVHAMDAQDNWHGDRKDSKEALVRALEELMARAGYLCTEEGTWSGKTCEEVRAGWKVFWRNARSGLLSEELDEGGRKLTRWDYWDVNAKLGVRLSCSTLKPVYEQLLNNKGVWDVTWIFEGTEGKGGVPVYAPCTLDCPGDLPDFLQ